MPALTSANIPIRTMSKARTDDLVYRPDPKGLHPGIDTKVKLPHQVRHAAATAEALSAGTAVPPTPPSNQARSRGFQHTDAEIDQVMEDFNRGALKHNDPRFKIIIELAREGARHIKARRRGAQQPRETSGQVTRRFNALLEAYRDLPRKSQATPTGVRTVAALRQSVIKKLGLRDNDDAISEDTIKKDVQQLGPLFRLVREGVIPPRGKLTRQSNISDKTRQEMKAGAKAVARAANAKKSRGGPGHGQER